MGHPLPITVCPLPWISVYRWARVRHSRSVLVMFHHSSCTAFAYCHPLTISALFLFPLMLRCSLMQQIFFTVNLYIYYNQTRLSQMRHLIGCHSIIYPLPQFRGRILIWQRSCLQFAVFNVWNFMKINLNTYHHSVLVLCTFCWNQPSNVIVSSLLLTIIPHICLFGSSLARVILLNH